MYNKIYDLIIIGASNDGIKVGTELANQQTLSIALVSSSWPKNIDKIANIDLITDRVIFSSYNHGLIGLTLQSNKNIFCKNVLITTGTKPACTDFKDILGIYYNINNINSDKNKQAVVINSANGGLDIALKLAKKFKYVYLCDETFELKGTEKKKEQFLKTDNVVFLPGCKLIDYTLNSLNKLKTITLDTFNTINTDTVVIATKKIPDVPRLMPKMISCNDTGHIKTLEGFKTTEIPNIYALGPCTDSNNKINIINFINYFKQENL